MKRCWLHVGMHKTGTTSVQHNLISVGNTHEWRYLCVGAKLHMNIPFFAMFAMDPHSYLWFGRLGFSREEAAERGKDLRSRLAEAIRSTSEETIIMSAEALTLIDSAGIQRLKDFLTPFFDEIRVIGYVRPPVSFKTSIFQELIKQGRKRFAPFDIKVSYREKFEKFDKAFGRENVTLVKFEPKAFPDNCIVSDFCNRTAIRLPAAMPVERVNDGLCREACGILYTYYKFGLGYGTGRRIIVENSWIIKPLQAMKGSRLAIRKSLFRNALDREKQDVAWMENRLGVSLEEKLEDKDSELATERELIHIERGHFESFVDHFESLNNIKVPRKMIPPGEILDPVAVSDFMELCKDLARVKSEKESRRRTRKRSKENPAERNPASSATSSFKRRIARKIRAFQGGLSDALDGLRDAIAGFVSMPAEPRHIAPAKKPSPQSAPSRAVPDPESTMATYKKAVRSKKKDPDAYIGLGRCQLKLGEWENAKLSIAAGIYFKPEERKWFRYYRYSLGKIRLTKMGEENESSAGRC